MYDGLAPAADRSPSSVISVRLLTKERAKIEARASSVGIGLSTYLRKVALSAIDRRRLPHNTARDGIARQLATICGEMTRIAAFCDHMRQTTAFRGTAKDDRFSNQTEQIDRIATELASLLKTIIELRDAIRAVRASRQL
jgi:hypothetical protein